MTLVSMRTDYDENNVRDQKYRLPGNQTALTKDSQPIKGIKIQGHRQVPQFCNMKGWNISVDFLADAPIFDRRFLGGELDFKEAL